MKEEAEKLRKIAEELIKAVESVEEGDPLYQRKKYLVMVLLQSFELWKEGVKNVLSAKTELEMMYHMQALLEAAYKLMYKEEGGAT